jgi:hypothetical protein
MEGSGMRPSSLPILAKSPKFVSSDTNFAADGTDRHEALRAHFAGDDSLIDLLDEESAESVRWAADYIRLKAPLSDYPLEWEVEMPIIYPDFSEEKGHADAACYLDIFDLKSRERDYGLQMAAYALGRLQSIQGGAQVRCHLLFTATKRAEVLTFDLESADKALSEALDAINAAAECRPSEYCGWCANRVTCEVLNKRAQAVAADREDWELEQYHASKITEPAEMSKALTLARQLSKWIDGIEFHAKEMAIKQGIQIPGYALKSRNGKKYCADIQGAFAATGLDAPTFLQCCDLRFSSSKKNPNKQGLENVYHKAAGLPSLAAAKRELKAKLQDFVRVGEPSLYLASEKSTETTDEE